MREGTFDPLATLAHQSAAFIVPDPVNPASKWLRPNSVLQPIDNSQELNYPAIARAIADTGFTGRGTG